MDGKRSVYVPPTSQHCAKLRQPNNYPKELVKRIKINKCPNRSLTKLWPSFQLQCFFSGQLINYYKTNFFMYYINYEKECDAYIIVFIFYSTWYPNLFIIQKNIISNSLQCGTVEVNVEFHVRSEADINSHL